MYNLSQDEDQRYNHFHRLKGKWAWIFLVIIFLIFFFWHHTKKNKHPTLSGLPVVVAKAQSQDVPIFLNGLGTVIPTYSVTVRTQVNGQLISVNFIEGQDVKKDDIIAEIDDRPILALITQYEGQLVRDKAQLANAYIDLKRYQQLWKEDSIAQQTLATQQALVQELLGSIQLDTGQLQTAKVNLIYTKIISPIDGRIGLRLVDPGNIVQTTDTNGIAIINTIRPITIVFTLPEDDVPALLKQIKIQKTLQVQALDRQQNQLLATGKLLTLDNQINTGTGTVKLKAQFDNNDNNLFPNQFVNAKLLLKTYKNAVVIPTSALQFKNQSVIVYVVKNNIVKATPVGAGQSINDQTIIKSGLRAGETVVIEGTDQLSNGTRIKIIPNSTSPSSSINIA